jgi:hypothetical protein
LPGGFWGRFLWQLAHWIVMLCFLSGLQVYLAAAKMQEVEKSNKLENKFSGIE